MFDEQLKLPVPPLDMIYNAAVAKNVNLVCGSLFVIVLLYGIKYWRETKSPIVILMLAGGLTTSLLEPYLDILGGCWHPTHGQQTAYEHMGRLIPVYAVFAYMFYVGVLGSINLVAFKKGVTTRAIWLWFAIPLIGDVIFEELMLRYDLYAYYGQQPLILVSKFPVWWAACNSIGEFLGITLLVLIGPALRGWKLLLIPLLIPMMYAAGYALTGLPAIIAVNTMNVPFVISQLAGVATFALTGLVVYGITLVLATDSPLRKIDVNAHPLSRFANSSATA